MKNKFKNKTVYVGLSGGVDSSVTAYLLLQAGYKVVGVYMKNWSQDIGSYRCPWREDYLAAKRLAAFLDIKFLVFDFQNQYKQLVVDYMIDEYQKGNTPNPDIQCNQEVKFKLFFKACQDLGADLIATGHYAQIKDLKLQKAVDQTKDQTYFLYRMDPKIFNKVIFPLGDYLKTQTRKLALKAQLPNALRAESMGICFVGKIGLVDFLKQYVQIKSGPIIDDQQRVVGQHQGAIFYTLGQRHGLNVGGGLPYYVVAKNIAKNEIYVSQNLQNPKLWFKDLNLRDTHWLVKPQIDKFYELRIRHGAKLIKVKLNNLDQKIASLSLKNEIKATASGQSAVLYDNEVVVGGGIICY